MKFIYEANHQLKQHDNYLDGETVGHLSRGACKAASGSDFHSVEASASLHLIALLVIRKRADFT